MYEQHFGLEKRPFGPSASGAEVFVGPQTAKLIAGLRNAVASQDAVFTVSGPVGTGKTTLVHRAIDALGIKYKTVRVGRMKMKSSEVLESLLVVLGVRNRPTGTMQRLAALRKNLKEHQDRGVRIFIVIEDAQRTGVESVAEIEALTSADAGESEGASIVVMGDENLANFMRDSQLTQLQQRVRQRHTILPLPVAELRGYLVHSFRQAGGSFEQIFDANSAPLLHHLSGGIPRLTNILVEAALATAANQGLSRIPATLIAMVAFDDFALSAEGFEFAVPDTADIAAGDETTAGASNGVAVNDAGSVRTESPDALAQDTAADEKAPDNAEDDIPHLIQDTLADIAVLSPASLERFAEDADDLAEIGATDHTEIVNEVSPDTALEPQTAKETRSAGGAAATPVTEIIPTLVVETRSHTENVPTLTEETGVRPHNIAERAIGHQPESERLAEPRRPGREPSAPATEIVPELTLDYDDVPTMVPVPDAFPDFVAEEPGAEVIPEWDCEPTYAEFEPDLDALEQAMSRVKDGPLDETGVSHIDTYTIEDIRGSQRIADTTTDLGGSLATGVRSSTDLAGSVAYPAEEPAVELDRVAAKIGQAQSLDEVDDKLAETLFGTEFCFVAEQALELELDTDAAQQEMPRAAKDLATERPAVIPVAEEVSVASLVSANDSGSSESAAAGQEVVPSLYTDLHPSLENSARATPKPTAKSAVSDNMPKSIEDQIDLSMTRTLEALKDPNDGSDEQAKTGFFRRFRRT